ncbi:MAG: hypothetical protein HFH47_01055 [Bacilli bacterium]|nr:hypothetical protein [Bacilli bacterium]
MKKLILILFVLCLTGCGNEDFTKTCKVKTKSMDLVNTETMEVSFNNKDEVTNVIITRNYKGNGDSDTIKIIKESADSYNNALLKKDGVKISIGKDEDNEYEVKYYLEVPKMDEKTLEIFNLKKNSVKFFNKMRNENIECK